MTIQSAYAKGKNPARRTSALAGAIALVASILFPALASAQAELAFTGG